VPESATRDGLSRVEKPLCKSNGNLSIGPDRCVCRRLKSLVRSESPKVVPRRSDGVHYVQPKSLGRVFVPGVGRLAARVEICGLGEH
jgi:hypothetical protein